MEILKFIVLQLISPLNLSLLCLLLSSFTFYFNKPQLSKVLRYFALGWILLCLQPYFGNLLMYSLENNIKPDIHKIEKPDFIFVLACYYDTEGNVSEISRWSECSLQRNTEAARLHYASGSPIIVSGGNFLKNEEVNYTTQSIDFFQSLGIEKSLLIGTYKGTTTQQEIDSAMSLMSDKSIWVVSSSSHIGRLKMKMADVSDSVIFFPTHYRSNNSLDFVITLPSQTALESTRTAFYEYLSHIKHYLSK